MKRNVIVCGLISGVILTALMLFSVALCYKNEDFEGNMVLGYAAMLLAFSLIFVGIKNFRDNLNGGFVSFGKAFKIGFLITLVASTMYVVVWLIDYYLFIPDFMDKYSAHVLRMAQKDSATAAELEIKVKDVASMKEMYKNPLMVILITFAEVLPIGLVVSLISAAILKRRTGNI